MRRGCLAPSAPIQYHESGSTVTAILETLGQTLLEICIGRHHRRGRVRQDAFSYQSNSTAPPHSPLLCAHPPGRTTACSLPHNTTRVPPGLQHNSRHCKKWRAQRGTKALWRGAKCFVCARRLAICEEKKKPSNPSWKRKTRQVQSVTRVIKHGHGSVLSQAEPTPQSSRKLLYNDVLSWGKYPMSRGVTIGEKRARPHQYKHQVTPPSAQGLSRWITKLKRLRRNSMNVNRGPGERLTKRQQLSCLPFCERCTQNRKDKEAPVTTLAAIMSSLAETTLEQDSHLFPFCIVYLSNWQVLLVAVE